MEQQCPARLAERQIAQFIKYNNVGVRQPMGQLSALARGLLLFKQVDQLDGREEPNPMVMMRNGLQPNGGRQMRLASPRWANHILLININILRT